MNQVELEHDMADGGRRKALARFAEQEDKGRAHENPYAQALYRRYILPLRDAIQIYTGTRKKGVAAKNKGLLAEHDPLALAFLTIRGLMDLCLTEAEVTMSHAAMTIGRTVYGECLLKHFDDVNPELYYTLVQDFERRMTKSERHKLAVFQDSARKDGIVLPQWLPKDKADVGQLLIGIAKDMGFIEIVMVRTGLKKTTNHIKIAPIAGEIVQQIKGFIAGVMPSIMPCVERPRPWVSPNDGGFHTQEMRRIQPTMIRGCALIDDDVVPQFVLDGLTLLQDTEWRVNKKVLEVAEIAHQKFDVQDVLVSDKRTEEPDRPIWMQENPDIKFDMMDEYQQVEFKAWCAEKREWHTDTKIRGAKSGRTNEAIAMANKFVDRPIWFVYTADYRGRFYASARGISPQGNDLSKGLLELNNGYKIEDPTALRWFCIAGANRWGEDKIRLPSRVDWVKANKDFILRIADDPVSNREWTGADSPFQFLAWAFEFAAWCRGPSEFRTRLPLGQDGSCNGLQHYSAMLRDPVGAAATNLAPDSHQHDIYAEVATATERLVGAAELDAEFGIAERWKRHALSRGLVKRSVMTLPYGSTRFSSAEFIQKEYLEKGGAPEFEKRERNKAATWLSFHVWDGIGQVVHKGREAMEWLQNASDAICAGDDIPATITWRSPSGFLVTQRYNAVNKLKFKTRMAGGGQIQISLRGFDEGGDARRHRNGIAPNFVHSCDAAHMHLFLKRAKEAGLEGLMLVHDDYGCPAPMVAKLHQILRETFVEMYLTHDPLAEFAERHGEFRCRVRPTPGDFDLTQVLTSEYFFC
ncbi:RNA polymerase [Pseudomonas phage PollyC]|uniref:DNA-directed RNA polymerase n=1 Tax=Pseudomonas phage PollyC TaxID=2079290 RepID=A0A2K9VHU7_9CAUD|nr:RNA polymerase [Pseudomonas phage PollyC]AUV61936.1 RNA polymerase [Pseudomonas phage PollyC]